jgi:amidohydrolase
MIADGALTNPDPDYAFGLHLWNSKPVGWVGSTDGPVMAEQIDWNCVISGVGGHAALPHLSRDPVVAAAQVVTATQSIVARNVNPLHAAVVSVSRIHGGDATNVVPGNVALAGTIRTFLPAVRELTKSRLREVTHGIASAMGCESTMTFTEGVSPVVNDSKASSHVRDIAGMLTGVTKVANDERTTASEDFGEFMANVPGCFFFVGSGNPEGGISYPHHHPRFDLDERALSIGAELMTGVAAGYVLRD